MKQYKIVKIDTGWAVATKSADEIVTQIYADRKIAAAACKTCETAEYFPGRKLKVWVIGEHFVCEAGLGGMQIGAVKHLDMNEYQVVRRLSQIEFDGLMNDFYEEESHYPDT